MQIHLFGFFFTPDIGDKLSEMLGKQTLATVKEKKLTKEEAERKAAILAQYSQVSDGEEYPCDNLFSITANDIRASCLYLI